MPTNHDEKQVDMCRTLLKQAAWRFQYKTRMHQIRESLSLYENQAFEQSFETEILSEMYVKELLDSIPWDKCRYIVQKTVIDGMSEKELALELNMTQQGVSKWKQKGLNTLKQHLILSQEQS